MSNFTELVKQRRSAGDFLLDHPISKKELEDIFELIKYEPTAFNLQHPNYIVVTNQEVKEKLREASGQYKVHSSSAVIVVTGNKWAYRDAAKIYEGLLLLGILTKQEFEEEVEFIEKFYTTRGEQFQKEEAIRNGALSAMLFMLAAKDKGWDTCPMIGFDPHAVRQILQIEENLEIVMMITIGKEKLSSRHPRGYRKPVEEFVKFI